MKSLFSLDYNNLPWGNKSYLPRHSFINKTVSHILLGCFLFFLTYKNFKISCILNSLEYIITNDSYTESIINQA